MNKSFYTIIGLVALSVFGPGCKTTAQNQQKAGNVQQIFDGKTLTNWAGDTALWRVENGSLVGEITPATLLKTNSFIIWRGGTPADFEFTTEFKISASGNSGINYRSVEVDNVAYALRGYQADIDGANNYTGQNYEERGRTTLAYRGEIVAVPESSGEFQSHLKNNAWTERNILGSLGSSDELKKKINHEGWNTCKLVAKGNHLQHFINGVLMSDVTDNDTKNRKMLGLIGVQVHVGPPMKVEYRNMYLKYL